MCVVVWCPDKAREHRPGRPQPSACPTEPFNTRFGFRLGSCSYSGGVGATCRTGQGPVAHMHAQMHDVCGRPIVRTHTCCWPLIHPPTHPLGLWDVLPQTTVPTIVAAPFSIPDSTRLQSQRGKCTYRRTGGRLSIDTTFAAFTTKTQRQMCGSEFNTPIPKPRNRGLGSDPDASPPLQACLTVNPATTTLPPTRVSQMVHGRPPELDR